jgi:hypothetical protein
MNVSIQKANKENQNPNKNFDTSLIGVSSLFKPLNNNNTTSKRGRKRKLLTKSPQKKDDLSVLLDDDEQDEFEFEQEEEQEGEEEEEKDDETFETFETQIKRSKYETRSSKSKNEKQILLTEIKQSALQFEQYIKASKNIVSLHCEFLRNEIGVQSEQLCTRVEQYHNNLVKQLNKYEKTCSKNTSKRVETRKYSDIIANVRTKLTEYDFDDSCTSYDELKQLSERINDAKLEYKNYIFGQKQIKFEKHSTVKDFNPIGSLKEKFLQSNSGLDIQRLIDNSDCQVDENNNNNNIDFELVGVEGEANGNGLFVAETVTIQNKTLKWVNIIENIRFKSVTKKTVDDNFQQFVRRIDYDKIILCKKSLASPQCEFKVVDVHSQQVRSVIQSEFQLIKFDLHHFVTNNQYVFVIGKYLTENYGLEKYDQQFSLYSRLEFDDEPMAIACNQNVVFVLVKNLVGEYFIEAYSCDELKKLSMKFVLDFGVDEVKSLEMYVNDGSRMLVVLNGKVCLRFEVEECCRLVGKVELKFILENFYVDSEMNLVIIEGINFSYYDLSRDCLVSQFRIENYEDGEKFCVTNDGYFVLVKKNFYLEIY